MNIANISIIVTIAILIYVAFTYNRIVVLKNFVKEAFATMDVYLKKRWDLVPNLVETVKGYSEYEQETFSNVTKLRTQNYSRLSNSEKIDLNTELSGVLNKLLAVAENYPNLKASEQFAKLMEQLNEIENDIANSRKYYNGSVRELNTFIEMFPSNIIANIFSIKKEKMFEIDNMERENIKVDF